MRRITMRRFVLFRFVLVQDNHAQDNHAQAVFLFVLFFFRRLDRYGAGIAIWAEPAWWRSAPRPCPSMSLRVWAEPADATE